MNNYKKNMNKLKLNGKNKENNLLMKMYKIQLIEQQLNNHGIISKMKIVYNMPVLGIEPVSNEIPEKFSLEQNYPNPFNPVTNIVFEIPKSSFVNLKVYDALGREIETLVSQQMQAGKYNADWNAENYPSGVYFYRLVTDNFSESNKMVLVK